MLVSAGSAYVLWAPGNKVVLPLATTNFLWHRSMLKYCRGGGAGPADQQLLDQGFDWHKFYFHQLMVTVKFCAVHSWMSVVLFYVSRLWNCAAMDLRYVYFSPTSEDRWCQMNPIVHNISNVWSKPVFVCVLSHKKGLPKNGPPGISFSETFGPRNLFFRKYMDPLWKDWTPWNLFFKRQLQNTAHMKYSFMLICWGHDLHSAQFSLYKHLPLPQLSYSSLFISAKALEGSCCSALSG